MPQRRPKRQYTDERTGRKRVVNKAAIAKIDTESRALAKQVTVKPVEITETMAATIVERMIETGSLRDACLADPSWPSATMFMRWAKEHNWADDIASAKAEYAALMLRRSVEEADKPIPWEDWADLEMSEKRLRVQMWLKHQEQRISARQFAAAQAAKMPSPVVQVNNNNVVVSDGSGLLAAAHIAYRESEDGKIIDHDDGDGGGSDA